MMSRGRGRRTATLVPGNGGALALRWRDDLSVAALLGLRDELDDMLGRSRSTRHIANPVFNKRGVICEGKSQGKTDMRRHFVGTSRHSSSTQCCTTMTCGGGEV